MKKRIKALALVLAAALLASGMALPGYAASEYSSADEKVTMIPVDAESVTDVSFTKNGGAIQFTYRNAALKDGDQCMILVVKTSGDGSYTVKESSILYIDQKAAGNGSVTFEVYPSSMTNSVILISSSSVTLAKVATVKVAYTLGDINSDGEINSQDAVLMNQHVAKLITLDSTAFLAADITHDGNVNSSDAVLLNQRIAGLISSFE